MKQKFKKACIVSMTFFLGCGIAWSQTEVLDSLARGAQEDNADFSFTESQLDDDADAAQVVSSVTSASSDPFLRSVGFRFSEMRFRVRAYDQAYSQQYMNGMLLNDLERGNFAYSMIGGMNDAVRNREEADGFGYNNFALTGIGGATLINTRASHFSQGNKVTISTTNRNYILRGMYTYATGWMPNGWAFAGTVGYRWSKEGVIEGTFYNSLSYLLSAEKKFNDEHSLSLVTFGSPTERGQQGAATEEVYWLANSHYYNPYWGYQNGKKRNSRVVRDYQPTFIATWDWKIDDNKKLTTAAGVKYSMYSNTALSYANNAYNPAPDYYKNLPSSIFNVWDPEINNPDNLDAYPFYKSQYYDLKNHWMSSKANRQIDWDRLYFVNEEMNKEGKTAAYYQERRHNDQLVLSLSPTWSHVIDMRNRYTVGLILNHTRGFHYKTMQDLLGANDYIDIDSYAERDYGKGSEEVQNDLRNPNRHIKQGDKFGYDYNIDVNLAQVWGMFQHNRHGLVINVGGHADGTTIERDGKMQNGRAKEYSYGKSGVASFLGGGGKVQLVFTPFANQKFTLSGSLDAKAPLAKNAFVAPRVQNNFVDGLVLEKIATADFSWQFRWGDFSGKVSGYATRIKDAVEQTAFYNDLDSRFYYVSMNGVNKLHYGVEGALSYSVTSKLSFNGLASIGEAKYTSNPNAQLFSENNSSVYKAWENPVTGEYMQNKIFADGIHVSGTPLTALSLGAHYNTNGWFLELDLNYYDRSYLGFSAYRRMGYVLQQSTSKAIIAGDNGKFPPLTDDIKKELEDNGGIFYNADGSIFKVQTTKQEELHGGFMLDASIGKFIRLRNGKAVSINLSLQNITNRTDIKTGGYEQSRSDFYTTNSGEDKGNDKTYKFSKNPKYFYANPFNAFLNINYRF